MRNMTGIAKMGIALLGVLCQAALLADDVFTVRAWAGFAAKANRRKDATLLFKGDRSCKPERIQYILDVRSGVPEFKYKNAKGEWRGFLYQAGGDVCEPGPGGQVIPSDKVVKFDTKATWLHLAAVFDHGSFTLYMNGRPVMVSKGRHESPPVHGDPLYVGHGQAPGGSEAFYVNGCVRREAYEKRAMSAEEIAAVYAAELPLVSAETPPELKFPTPVEGVLPMTAAYLGSPAAKPMPRGSNCVSRIVMVNGIPRVCVDGEVVSGMAMMPSPHVDNPEVTFSCNDFAAAGVRIFSNIFWGGEPQNKWWLGEGRYDWAYYDARLKAMIDAAPNGWVFPRIKMDPPPWWRKQHPDEYYGRQIRADSEKWKSLRDQMLRDVVTHIENSPLAPYVVGYHIGALSGTEWLIFDPKVNRQIAAMTRAERQTLFDHRSKAAADALIDAAGLVKRLVGHRKIVGSFFGYSFIEHRDAARVYACPDLDFFAAPHSYGHRRGGQSGRSNVFALASARLHGKIFWMESDDRTLYARTDESYRCTTLQESVDVLKRAIGFTLAEGWETWWFLLVGNNTFHDETIMRTIARGQDEAVRFGLKAPARTESDVAVFRRVQELDYGPYSPKADEYGYDAFCRIYPRSGVAYDCYMFEDVLSKDLPDYKVYVFNDAKTISPAEREAIDRLVRRRGRTAIWMNAEKEAVVSSPEGWRQLDFTRPPVPQRLRAVLAESGAHVWLDSDDFVLPGRGYLMVHAATPGEKRISLPQACDLVEIFDRKRDRLNVKDFTESMYKGETLIYRMVHRRTP